mgnify:CR=1 FL=1
MANVNNFRGEIEISQNSNGFETLRRWGRLIIASAFITILTALILYAIYLDNKLLIDRFDILFGMLIGATGSAFIFYELSEQKWIGGVSYMDTIIVLIVLY